MELVSCSLQAEAPNCSTHKPIYHLKQLLRYCNCGIADLTVDKVKQAWEDFPRFRMTKGKYSSLRTHLARALRACASINEHANAMAYIVNPKARANSKGGVIPGRVRQLGEQSIYFKCFQRIAKLMAMQHYGHLKTSGCAGLRSVMLLYDKVLNQLPITTEDVDTHWDRMVQVVGSIDELVQFYDTYRRNTGVRVSLDRLKRDIRALYSLHNTMGNGASRGCTRSTIAHLRGDLCHDGTSDPPPLVETVYGFTCAEVRRLVHFASSTLERLVVMLFLTTGVRIGGMCRLCFYPKEAPNQLTTREKNGAIRHMALTKTCRTLLELWYDGERRVRLQRLGAGDNSHCPYVFVGSRDIKRPMSPDVIYNVCRTLFHRAGVVGTHAHPHTFRHTCIHMLFMNGLNFEVIAKWIGHTSPSVTSGVYGRLRTHDIQALVHKATGFVPHPCSNGKDNEKEWNELAKFLVDPYAFTASQLQLVTSRKETTEDVGELLKECIFLLRQRLPVEANGKIRPRHNLACMVDLHENPAANQPMINQTIVSSQLGNVEATCKGMQDIDLFRSLCHTIVEQNIRISP